MSGLIQGFPAGHRNAPWDRARMQISSWGHSVGYTRFVTILVPKLVASRELSSLQLHFMCLYRHLELTDRFSRLASSTDVVYSAPRFSQAWGRCLELGCIRLSLVWGRQTGASVVTNPPNRKRVQIGRVACLKTSDRDESIRTEGKNEEMQWNYLIVTDPIQPNSISRHFSVYSWLLLFI